MTPLCSSTIDVSPICPPTVCPIVPPSVPPVDSPTVPPIGTSQCHSQLVLNPNTSRYDWQRVCQ
jgi:hypothetical protein